MMTLRHSPEVDALSIELSDRKIAVTDAISRNDYYERGVDYAEDDTPVGVELLNVSRGVDLSDVPRADEIARLLAEHDIRVLV